MKTFSYMNGRKVLRVSGHELARALEPRSWLSPSSKEVRPGLGNMLVTILSGAQETACLSLPSHLGAEERFYQDLTDQGGRDGHGRKRCLECDFKD